MYKFSIINLPTTQFIPAGEATYAAAEELKLHRIFSARPMLLGGRMVSPALTFVCDYETIAHRLDMFDDLRRVPALCDLLEAVLPLLANLAELTRTRDDVGKFAYIEYFMYVTKLNVYVQCVQKLYAGLTTLREKIKAAGFLHLYERVAAVHESAEFTHLVENLAAFGADLLHIKSITVGINLDGADLDEIGIVAVNTEPYRSGQLLDKILRADFRSTAGDPFVCMTMLEPMFKGLNDVQKHEVNRSFKSAFDGALKKTLRGIQPKITAYMKEQGQFLVDIHSEVNFLVSGAAFIRELTEKRVPMTKPRLSTDNTAQLDGLVNLHLAQTLDAADIRPGDIHFDAQGMVYILTGANSGGKSVFLFAVGLAQLLFQLGLYVPARAAVMTPADHICVHLSAKAAVQEGAGRLEQECMALNKLLPLATAKSLVLMDEPFASTGAYDGSVLAEEVLKQLARLGCKCIFSTHIHELTARIAPINARAQTVGKLDSLVAVSNAGQRTYRIARHAPEGHSHAKDIAKKYGLVFDFD